MPDFADNLTLRVRMKYRCQGEDHEIQFRGGLEDGEPEVEALLSKMHVFLNAAPGIRFTDWVVLNYSYCMPGEDLWRPHAAPSSPALLAGTATTAGRTEGFRAVQCRFEARSLDGVRSSVSLFGTAYTPALGSAADYRISTTEDVSILNSVTALEETAPVLRAANGTQLIWSLYANIKANDHYVDKLRS